MIEKYGPGKTEGYVTGADELPEYAQPLVRECIPHLKNYVEKRVEFYRSAKGIVDLKSKFKAQHKKEWKKKNRGKNQNYIAPDLHRLKVLALKQDIENHFEENKGEYITLLYRNNRQAMMRWAKQMEEAGYFDKPEVEQAPGGKISQMPTYIKKIASFILLACLLYLFGDPTGKAIAQGLDGPTPATQPYLGLDLDINSLLEEVVEAAIGGDIEQQNPEDPGETGLEFYDVEIDIEGNIREDKEKLWQYLPLIDEQGILEDFTANAHVEARLLDDVQNDPFEVMLLQDRDNNRTKIIVITPNELEIQQTDLGFVEGEEIIKYFTTQAGELPGYLVLETSGSDNESYILYRFGDLGYGDWGVEEVASYSNFDAVPSSVDEVEQGLELETSQPAENSSVETLEIEGTTLNLANNITEEDRQALSTIFEKLIYVPGADNDLDYPIIDALNMYTEGELAESLNVDYVSLGNIGNLGFERKLILITDNSNDKTYLIQYIPEDSKGQTINALYFWGEVSGTEPGLLKASLANSSQPLTFITTVDSSRLFQVHSVSPLGESYLPTFTLEESGLSSYEEAQAWVEENSIENAHISEALTEAERTRVEALLEEPELQGVISELSIKVTASSIVNYRKVNNQGEEYEIVFIQNYDDSEHYAIMWRPGQDSGDATYLNSFNYPFDDIRTIETDSGAYLSLNETRPRDQADRFDLYRFDPETEGLVLEQQFDSYLQLPQHLIRQAENAISTRLSGLTGVKANGEDKLQSGMYQFTLTEDNKVVVHKLIYAGQHGNIRIEEETNPTFEIIGGQGQDQDRINLGDLNLVFTNQSPSQQEVQSRHTSELPILNNEALMRLQDEEMVAYQVEEGTVRIFIVNITDLTAEEIASWEGVISHPEAGWWNVMMSPFLDGEPVPILPIELVKLALNAESTPDFTTRTFAVFGSSGLNSYIANVNIVQDLADPDYIRLYLPEDNLTYFRVPKGNGELKFVYLFEHGTNDDDQFFMIATQAIEPNGSPIITLHKVTFRYGTTIDVDPMISYGYNQHLDENNEPLDRMFRTEFQGNIEEDEFTWDVVKIRGDEQNSPKFVLHEVGRFSDSPSILINVDDTRLGYDPGNNQRDPSFIFDEGDGSTRRISLSVITDLAEANDGSGEYTEINASDIIELAGQTVSLSDLGADNLNSAQSGEFVHVVTAPHNIKVYGSPNGDSDFGQYWLNDQTAAIISSVTNRPGSQWYMVSYATPNQGNRIGFIKAETLNLAGHDQSRIENDFYSPENIDLEMRSSGEVPNFRYRINNKVILRSDVYIPHNTLGRILDIINSSEFNPANPVIINLSSSPDIASAIDGINPNMNIRNLSSAYRLSFPTNNYNSNLVIFRFEDRFRRSEPLADVVTILLEDMAPGSDSVLADLSRLETLISDR